MSTPAADNPQEPGRPDTRVPARRTRRAATFAALSNANFRRFFYGQAVSMIGTWMQSVAQAWLVLDLTGSGHRARLGHRPANRAGALPRAVRRPHRRPRRQAAPAGRHADRHGDAGARARPAHRDRQCQPLDGLRARRRSRPGQRASTTRPGSRSCSRWSARAPAQRRHAQLGARQRGPGHRPRGRRHAHRHHRCRRLLPGQRRYVRRRPGRAGDDEPRRTAPSPAAPRARGQLREGFSTSARRPPCWCRSG